MSNEPSSYLRYLPPVLWRDDPSPPEFSLGAMLRVFEKILTGIDDGVVVTHGGHDHDSIQTVIDRIFRLFDPWTTPPQYLDWLASWVALKFPAPWDEYQRRKVTAGIVQVYRKRGLKAGLTQYLDVYTVTDRRPRIAIDDCSKVLYTRPVPGRFAPIHTLLSQVDVTLDKVRDFPIAVSGMIAPLCLRVGPDGSLFVGDAGTDSGFVPTARPAVWQISPPEYALEMAGAAPKPKPVGPLGLAPHFPLAVATDRASPYHLFVLNSRIETGGPPGAPALYRLTSPGFATVVVLGTDTQLGTVWPVDMVFDPPSNALLILDRGTSVFSGLAAVPKVLVVAGIQGPPPMTVVTHSLTTVVEPQALAILPGGDLLIADAGDQTNPVAAGLVRVVRGGVWVESDALAGVPAGSNPLVAPTAVVARDASSVYVADVGLKPVRTILANPYVKLIANPSAVYLVDLAATPATITRVSEAGQLVSHTAIDLVGDTLYLADRGLSTLDQSFSPPVSRVWRASANEFAVAVHFADARTTPQRARIVEDIREIVDQVRPAHTYWTMLSP